MKHLLKAAHEEVATQFAAEKRSWCDAGAVRRLIVSSAVGVSLAFGSAAPVHAGDGETYGAIIGGAIGTILGAKMTQKQNDYSVRAAAVLAAGTAGTLAGKKLGAQFENSRAQPQQVSTRSDGYNDTRYTDTRYSEPRYSDNRAPVREVVYVEHVERPRVVERYEAPRRAEVARRSYQRPAEPAWESSPAADFSASSSGFNPVLCAPLERHQVSIVPSGSRDLGAKPLYKARIAKAMEGLLSSARKYEGKLEAWDDAATLVGQEGVTARLRVADQLIAARRDLDSKMLDFAQVRNAIAQQGFDVGAQDAAVIERTQNLAEPTRYALNESGGPRPTIR